MKSILIAGKSSFFVMDSELRNLCNSFMNVNNIDC